MKYIHSYLVKKLCIGCILFGGFTASADTIRMGWYEDEFYQYSRRFTIVHHGEFTIDWGDGSAIDTMSGNYWTDPPITHYYTISQGTSYVITITGNNFFGFECSGNKLDFLDLTGCNELWHLECNSVQLTDLDLSECPKLSELDCSNNKLSFLDLSICPRLRYLLCNNNLLATLDISANTKLEVLKCDNNQLTSLDLSTITVLYCLHCNNNLLTTLNLSANTELRELLCYNNQLSVLDASGSTKYERLSCQNNQLQIFKLHENTVVWGFDCSKNRLQLSDLYNVKKMTNYSIHKYLGIHQLYPREVRRGDTVDYSAQSEFDGIATTFVIEKNGLISAENIDYVINNGIITFKDTGYYTVSMMNDSILSYVYFDEIYYLDIYPAEVIAEIKVLENVEIVENASYELRVASYEVYDMLGRTLVSSLRDLQNRSKPEKQMNIQDCFANARNDVSHLASGIYIIRMQTDQGIVTKKIVKN